jgi:hypothetical protein
MPSRPWSIEELAAGNARGISGGDPLVTETRTAIEAAATTERSRTRSEDDPPPEWLQLAIVARSAEVRAVGTHRRLSIAARVMKALGR